MKRHTESMERRLKEAANHYEAHREFGQTLAETAQRFGVKRDQLRTFRATRGLDRKYAGAKFKFPLP